MSSGTWQVMRRELDRTVLVVACATNIEAEAARRATLREHPNEDAWIERNGGAEVTETEMIPDETPIQSTPTRIPEARVVGALARPKPREVPWPAKIYMIGPTISAVAGVLIFGGGFMCMPSDDRHQHGLHLFSAQVEDVLGRVGGMWILLACVVVGVAAVYEGRFLRRARVVEGVMTNGKIEITIEGEQFNLASIAPPVVEGTRLPLFWRGSRLVELSKAGARLDPNGEVRWDAKPYPYKFVSWWPRSFVVAGAVIIAMFVMLVIALS